MLAFAGTWLAGGYSDSECVALYPNVPELTAVSEKVGLWPSGAKCDYELPNGTEVSRSRAPWLESLFVLLCAGIAVLASRSWKRLAVDSIRSPE